jgi:hypothetical protein
MIVIKNRVANFPAVLKMQFRFTDKRSSNPSQKFYRESIAKVA